MGDEPNSGFDVDLKALEREEKELEDIIQQNKETEENDTLVENQDAQETAQALAEQKDPRDAEQWGFKALVKEGQSILSGGLQDTASSIATFPERTVDALSGEMARERKEKGYYRPEFHPFTDYENPIITKTWWGKLLRGTVHFGSMAAAIIPTAKVTAARTGLSIAALGGKTLGSSLLRASAVGAATDLVSKESDGHNALGALNKKYSWIDTPLTTKDTDHPIWMKFKNIVEGMGIGLIFDGASVLVGKGSKKVMQKVAARNESIKAQSTENGVAQIRKGVRELRADKNKPLTQPHQGAHLSQEPVEEVVDRMSRSRNEWLADEGSAGTVTTPLERERIAREAGDTEEVVERVLQELWSTEYYQSKVKEVQAKRTTMTEAFGDAVLAHQRITNGRNAADMSADEYLKELRDAQTDIVDDQYILTTSKVLAGDLVVGTLFQQLRDTGIAARELTSLADITDVDGPAYQLADTLISALAMTKRARALKSQALKNLDDVSRAARAKEMVAKDIAESKEAIMTMLKIAKDEPENDLVNAIVEAFSQMKDVHSMDDFDTWARKMIRGGELNKFDRTGAAIRELEGVMIHSVLSGPKTAIRAIMGTSTATFLRPFSQALGATMMYPFQKDTATLRSSLASLNAMMQAIPESFELFKTRLNSYWSGDISTIKSRFTEYTRDDNNWEILRRWAEDSGRATDGDRAAFFLANQARNLNNNSFFTYSTKIMAATDDTFRYILGRAKMREKAMRNAMELQGAGKLPEIDPQVLRAYEDDFYSQIFDGNGDLLDEATKFAASEVTLTQPLTGFAKGLNDVFTANPWAKPFFLFARTGVNGLSLTAKHTPGFNFVVKEWNEIAWAKPNNLEAVAKYGITTAEELANAQALQVGRLGIGTALVSMASWAWMSGNLSGNGPVDRQKRQAWIDAGYRQREITVGGVTIGYDSIEPFAPILSTIADIGDASLLMGEEWTEKQLLKVSLVLAQGITSKSYLAGMQMFVDLVGGRPGQAERILASLMNNTLPASSLRNELGKLINPHMKELGSGIDQSIRNRNLTSEYIAGQPLPTKYDILDSDPIKDHDFLTRAYNFFSPIPLNLKQSPGRRLLFRSGYDLRTSINFSPGGRTSGIDLSDYPRLRSEFQQALGQQNLEAKFNKAATDPKILASIEEMEFDIRNGNRSKYEAMDYWHNTVFRKWFTEAKQIAWAQVSQRPHFQEVIQDQREAQLGRIRKQRETSLINEVQPLLQFQPK